MYKHLDRLNVKPNLPDIKSAQYTVKKFRTSAEICKYDCSLEETFLKESTTTENASNAPNGSSVSGSNRRYSVRNEEIAKSLAELDSVSDNKKEVASSGMKRKTSVVHLRMKAETAAELYLGVDDTALVLRFLDFYVALMEQLENSVNVSDEKIVKAFGLFEGNVEKSGQFLAVAEELEELGFASENVTSALMLFSNDREAALDFLMKNY